ncbi:hypothetical protein ACHAW6_004843 [Cyclotella cf. meneghiniana]
MDKYKHYLLLITPRILQKCSDYKYLQHWILYNTIQDLCTIITTFGKYKFLRLPMGLKCSPDIALSIMESVLAGINDADVYIDDVLLGNILPRPHKKGITINPLKCECAIKEADWLGFWPTPRGLKPSKKENTILHIDHPWTITELHMFIGCINYYQDMVEKACSNTLDSTHAKIFEKMYASMVADILTANPDHNKWFDVYTDESDYQLGACSVQEDHPVAHFSSKLSKSQQNYMIEKEIYPL